MIAMFTKFDAPFINALTELEDECDNCDLTDLVAMADVRMNDCGDYLKQGIKALGTPLPHICTSRVSLLSTLTIIVQRHFRFRYAQIRNTLPGTDRKDCSGNQQQYSETVIRHSSKQQFEGLHETLYRYRL